LPGLDLQAGLQHPEQPAGWSTMKLAHRLGMFPADVDAVLTRSASIPQPHLPPQVRANPKKTDKYDFGRAAR
jgi:hypothetical protein